MTSMSEVPQPGDTIVVWFSNGAASAIAWQETLLRYGLFCDVRAVNNLICLAILAPLAPEKNVEGQGE